MTRTDIVRQAIRTIDGAQVRLGSIADKEDDADTTQPEAIRAVAETLAAVSALLALINLGGFDPPGEPTTRS